jgi:hypothetical protein
MVPACPPAQRRTVVVRDHRKIEKDMVVVRAKAIL